MDEKIARLVIDGGPPQMDGHKRYNRLKTRGGSHVVNCDDLAVFDPGDDVVVILESEYERLKTLDERVKRFAEGIGKPRDVGERR